MKNTNHFKLNNSFNELQVLDCGNNLLFYLKEIVKEKELKSELVKKFKKILTKKEVLNIYENLEFKDLLFSFPIGCFVHEYYVKSIHDSSCTSFKNLDGEFVKKEKYSRWQTSTKAVFNISHHYIERYVNKNHEYINDLPSKYNIKKLLISSYILSYLKYMQFSVEDYIFNKYKNLKINYNLSIKKSIDKKYRDEISNTFELFFVFLSGLRFLSLRKFMGNHFFQSNFYNWKKFPKDIINYSINYKEYIKHNLH